jgi:hypothetical protein
MAWQGNSMGTTWEQHSICELASTGHPKTFLFIKSHPVKTYPCTQDWDLTHLQHKEYDLNPIHKDKFHWMDLDKEQDNGLLTNRN